MSESEASQKARVVCLNLEVARSLRAIGLGVFPDSEKPPYPPVYDLAPVVYVHAPWLIVAEPLPQRHGDAEADSELKGLFYKAMRESGAPGLPVLASVDRLLPELRQSIAAGHVLGLVFAEKVAVDDRLALLPWGAWREAKRLQYLGGSYHQWQKAWSVPPDQLTLTPSLEYTAAVLKDLLPVRPPPASWTVPLVGRTPTAESLRRERIWMWQSDLSGVGQPGFHFKVQEAPMEVLPAEGAPAWAASLLPPNGLKVRVVIQAHNCTEYQKQKVTELIAKSYGLPAASVRTAPLFVNRLGQWLACAVRINRGAVLILPECRDQAAKARVVRMLATELWKSVQEWLHGASATSAKATEKPAHINSEGVPESRGALKQDEAGKLARLEKDTPAFDRDSGEWVKNTDAARIESVESATLRKYRTNGIRNADGTLGRDPDGRVWRRPGTKRSHPWYLKSTLLSVKNSAKNRQDKIGNATPNVVPTRVASTKSFHETQA